ncbi:hypothetical protein GE09DRAFT_1064979 [Coniochaeta sp. 2T2.1]|nr:hypothetical protein GE09DRAFT_1064979 [Coniochaeta sp. 2T2.1]
MADYDPADQGGAWEENEDYGDAEGFNTQHSTPSDDQEQEQAHLSHDQAMNAAPGDVPSDDGASDTGDYDPDAVSSSFAPTPQIAEPAAAARPSPKPTAKKPKTAGGFVVDSDSEDEDDSTSTPGSSGGLAPPPNQTRPRTVSPLQNVTTITEASAPIPSNQAHSTQHTSLVAPSSGHDQPSTPPLPAANTQATPAQDKVAVLEDSVSKDPRGAMDAWLALIREYRDRSKLNDARKTYDRFLEVFPQAADIWADYIDMELGMNNFVETERLFGMCLLSTPNVNLWTKYLDYIRRRNDLNDSTGHARQVVAQSYEFVIENIGVDKDSGKIWAEYIQFIKFGPGTVGGSSWQDQQKMDQLRKAYQRAICVPIQNVNTLWKEYDQFEMGLNKTTGRKFLAERSPAYMSAKSANTALENVTRGLNRTNLPRLPPAPGFDGDVEFMDQVEIWKRWVAFEKSDPLEIRTDEPELFQKRILYAYKQALMALRFWPEMWVDAAEWCFENNIIKDGTDVGLDFLRQGITANPESVLLALKHADRIEATYPIEENDEAKIARGQAVREPYNKVLDTLYDLIKVLKEREEVQTTRIQAAAAQAAAASSSQANADYDDDDEETQAANEKARKEQTEKQLEAVKQGFAAQTQLLSRTVSFVWIALARAMRRIQGKGKPGTPLGGMRQVFIDARPRGRLTSDVYVAMAQLEWTVYKEPAGAKIFERGAKLFPEDENFTVEYLKFLHSRDDFTNARVVFETVVNRLTQKPESVHKAKPLYAYFHKFESQFGELAQISKLEKRMAELFPEDPKLSHFTARFSTDKFDPIAARIIVSPTTQLKPKFPIMPSIEQRQQSVSVQDSPRPQHRAPVSPRPQYLQARDSPKRPFPTDDFDDLPPRKAMRGEQQDFIRGASPLKGAAGRRLDQQRRGGASQNAAAPIIPRDVSFLLGIIPPAHTYNQAVFPPSGVIRLLNQTHIPEFTEWKNGDRTQHNRNIAQALAQSHNRQPSGDYAAHSYQNRDSPNPQGRPQSPYTGSGRLAPGGATYRQSSLRPGSRDSYEPPPAAYSQLGQQGHYGQAPPPQQGQYDAGAAAGGWPTYGAPPAGGAPQGYGAPAPYGQVPQQPPAQYQQYPY